MCTWGEYLTGNGHEEVRGPPRRPESTGRPLGDKTFLAKIGALLGRDVVPKNPGRKRKDRK